MPKLQVFPRVNRDGNTLQNVSTFDTNKYNINILYVQKYILELCKM